MFAVSGKPVIVNDVMLAATLARSRASSRMCDEFQAYVRDRGVDARNFGTKRQT